MLHPPFDCINNFYRGNTYHYNLFSYAVVEFKTEQNYIVSWVFKSISLYYFKNLFHSCKRLFWPVCISHSTPYLNQMQLSLLYVYRYHLKKKIHKNKWGKELIRSCCPKRAHDPLPPKPIQYFETEFIALHPLYRFLFVGFSAVALFTWGYWYCCCPVSYTHLTLPTKRIV